MRIRNIKVNGISSPVGFELLQPHVSWKVDQTNSMKQTKSRIELIRNGEVCWKKEGFLDSSGERIFYNFSPRTEYQVKITVWGDQGDKGEGITINMNSRL